MNSIGSSKHLRWKCVKIVLSISCGSTIVSCTCVLGTCPRVIAQDWKCMEASWDDRTHKVCVLIINIAYGWKYKIVETQICEVILHYMSHVTSCFTLSLYSKPYHKYKIHLWVHNSYDDAPVMVASCHLHCLPGSAAQSGRHPQDTLPSQPRLLSWVHLLLLWPERRASAHPP